MAEWAEGQSLLSVRAQDRARASHGRAVKDGGRSARPRCERGRDGGEERGEGRWHYKKQAPAPELLSLRTSDLQLVVDGPVRFRPWVFRTDLEALDLPKMPATSSSRQESGSHERTRTSGKAIGMAEAER